MRASSTLDWRSVVTARSGSAPATAAALEAAIARAIVETARQIAQRHIDERQPLPPDDGGLLAQATQAAYAEGLASQRRRAQSEQEQALREAFGA